MGKIEIYGGYFNEEKVIGDVCKVGFKDNTLLYRCTDGHEGVMVLGLNNRRNKGKLTDRVQVGSVESTGVHIKDLTVGNCAMVEGNVEYLTVGNCAYIYGSVMDSTVGNRLCSDCDDVLVHIEKDKDFMSTPVKGEYERSIIELSGDFEEVIVNSVGAVEVWLRNSVVKNLTSSNCVSIEGNVKRAKVGNMLYTRWYMD